MKLKNKCIAVSKTNHIGDVAISLPVLTLIKKAEPDCHLIFFGKGVACDVAKMHMLVDDVINWEDIESAENPSLALARLQIDIFIQLNPCKRAACIVKNAQVAIRIGSGYRLYNWYYCNRLAFIPRRALNKRQLDIAYLKQLAIDTNISESEIGELYTLKSIPLRDSIYELLSPNKFNLVIHPGAVTTNLDRWPIAKYLELINSLDKQKIRVFISGTKEDYKDYQQLIIDNDDVVNLMGEMTLLEFFSFLAKVDGFVAGSTGPLHLASAQDTRTIGLYCSNKNYIKRWHPLGSKSLIIKSLKVADIPTSQVLNAINQWIKESTL